ncbi:MAG: alpha/beta fold hydrolase [Candidatus Lokiarchaeota archaeon]|nr:alpha/beta fold hydrolase [Candidatus Lokiarchaeota archaeon]
MNGITFFGDIEKRDQNQLIMLFLAFILFFFSLTVLHFNKSQSYQSYQQIEFDHADATLFANLYYPTNRIEFQEKRPLVIYVHGLGNDRNFDIHFPIELVKRGFFVATLDYHGHGQSSGTIYDINQKTGRLAIYEDVSKLLDVLENLPIYSSRINSSQIALVGHSLGGAIVLMTTILDNRINTTVVLAPLVNYGVLNHPNFENNMPVDHLNKTNTKNLLIMAHSDDDLLNYQDHAQVAYNKTNCSISIYNEAMVGGPHSMLSDNSVKEMISWIEMKFFGFINGAITTDYIYIYIFLAISLIILFIIIFLIISLVANFFSFKKIEVKRKILEEKNTYTKKEKISRILGIFSSTIIFLTIWVLFSNYFRLIGIFYSSFLLLGTYGFAYLILYLRKNRDSKNKTVRLKTKIKNRFKQEFKINYFMYGFLASGIFQGFYLAFTISYPFAFVWPSNLRVVLLGFSIFPIFLSMELFYRSIIYPLLDFIDTERTKSKIIVVVSVFIQFLIIYLSRIWVFIPGLMVTYIAFLAVIIVNTLIYEKIKSIAIRFVFAIDILFFFFGSAITTVLGIDVAIYLLL